MKKLLSLAVILCCLMSFLLLPVSAITDTEEATTEEQIGEEAVTEENTTEEQPLGRLMCDINKNGKIEAADARTILRFSVGLDEIDREDLFYADADFSCNITAADARMALRMSVSLEETKEYAFEITETEEATCGKHGRMKATCALTGQNVEYVFPSLTHKYPDEAYCTGKGVCELCGKEATVVIKHKYESDSCKGQKICSVCKDTVSIPVEHDFEEKICNPTIKCKKCGYEEQITPVHLFEKGICTACGRNLKVEFGKFAKDYLIKNGTYSDEMYYVYEETDGMAIGLVYDKTVGFTYAVCTVGFNMNGLILYCDVYFDFEANTSELMYYDVNGVVYAYAYGTVEPEKVDENANGDAITITEQDVVPELKGYEAEFKRIMEGATYSTVEWLRDYAVNTMRFTDAGEIFTAFINVK